MKVEEKEFLIKKHIMNIEKVYNGIRYTLSNDNLETGDKVYSIGNGRCLDDGGWILHNLDFRDFTSGFPDEPHTIKNLNYSDYKPSQVQTDFGYSPIECYYKIIKKEHQIKEDTKIFASYKWVEIE
jgi:hypothetical protein